MTFFEALQSQVGPTETGFYLRPFVADGHPSECRIALIGYNPATAIPSKEIARDEYCRLLCDRPAFEKFYSDYRMRLKQSQGKRPQPFSTTRKRLGLIRTAFGSDPVVETNLNAWPTKDTTTFQLLSPSAKMLGQKVAAWALGLLNPELVVAYGEEIEGPASFEHLVGMKSLAPAKDLNAWLRVFPRVSWQDGTTRLVHIRKHLAARGQGVTDQRFALLGREIAQWVRSCSA